MADDLLSQIRLNGAVPRHVAVIMDGNGRWARERSLPRPLGHRAGMKAVREAVEGALEAGVEVLTLFAFSEENWQRPATEISALMRLLEEYIAREVAELKDQGVAVHVLGDRARLTDGGGAHRAGDTRRRAASTQSVHLLLLARRAGPGGAPPCRRGAQGCQATRGHRRGRDSRQALHGALERPGPADPDVR